MEGWLAVATTVLLLVGREGMEDSLALSVVEPQALTEAVEEGLAVGTSALAECEALPSSVALSQAVALAVWRLLRVAGGERLGEPLSVTEGVGALSRGAGQGAGGGCGRCGRGGHRGRGRLRGAARAPRGRCRDAHGARGHEAGRGRGRGRLQLEEGVPGRWRWSQNRSARSLCSDRLMLTSPLPLALASASTSDVMPTPGLPSMRMGLAPCCMPRSTRSRLQRAVGAPREKEGTLGGRGPRGGKAAPQ